MYIHSNKEIDKTYLNSKQIWFIPFVDKRVGGRQKLCGPLKTRATPESLCDGVSQWRGAISHVLCLYLNLIKLYDKGVEFRLQPRVKVFQRIVQVES